MIEFEYGRAETVGARNYQEDSCAFSPLRSSKGTNGGSPNSEQAAGLLAILADGMGGHVGGALASKIACQTFDVAFKQKLTEVAREQPERASQQALYQGLFASNQEIHNQVIANAEMQGMGCTLVGVRFDARGMMWVSVGDSPLYLIRDGRIDRLNADHSLAPMLDNMVRSGEMTREVAEAHPQRNALRSAVMGNKIDIFDLSPAYKELRPGDWVILASDGLNTLPNAQIHEIVKERYRFGAQEVANSLIKVVDSYRFPHQDNTTVMVVAPYMLTKTGARPAPAMSISRMPASPEAHTRPLTAASSGSAASAGGIPIIYYVVMASLSVLVVALAATLWLTNGGKTPTANKPGDAIQKAGAAGPQPPPPPNDQIQNNQDPKPQVQPPNPAEQTTTTPPNKGKGKKNASSPPVSPSTPSQSTTNP